MSQPFPRPPRYGVHLTPDPTPLPEAHFRRVLTQALDLGLGWVVANAPASRAFPEEQIRPWLDHGVQVVLHLWAHPAAPPSPQEMEPLLRAYARWGVRHLIWLEHPNMRAAWGRAWAAGDPAERTADALFPLLRLAYELGLTSLLPPLVQGGDYWDTAFFRRLLEELARRDETLVAQLGVGVEARALNRPLSWGQGGPEAWPETQPYRTPADSQDQQGFCAFDWYAAIAQAVVGRPLPMFLMRMGPQYRSDADAEEVTREMLAVAALMGGQGPRPEVRLHPAVFGGAFWVLTAPAGSPANGAAWLPAEGPPRPIVERLRPAVADLHAKGKAEEPYAPSVYVLLPADPALRPWALDVVRPLLLHWQATVGFSGVEAAKARRVVVVGGTEAIPEAEVEALRRQGCLVQRVQTGTEVASLLASTSNPEAR